MVITSKCIIFVWNQMYDEFVSHQSSQIFMFIKLIIISITQKK